VTGVACHVADKAQRTTLISETIKRFGKLDILVSNAAVNPTFGPLLQVRFK
jgi:dehydrogenase/reductase SDR family protein 4